LARLLNGAFGVLAAVALAGLVRDHLTPRGGAAAGLVFFTLPITWSLMTRAGSDLSLALYTCLAVSAFFAWRADDRTGDLRRAALCAGFGGGSTLMGPLLPALLGVAVLLVLARRALPLRRALGSAFA